MANPRNIDWTFSQIIGLNYTEGELNEFVIIIAYDRAGYPGGEVW